MSAVLRCHCNLAPTWLSAEAQEGRLGGNMARAFPCSAKRIGSVFFLLLHQGRGEEDVWVYRPLATVSKFAALASLP